MYVLTNLLMETKAKSNITNRLNITDPKTDKDCSLQIISIKIQNCEIKYCSPIKSTLLFFNTMVQFEFGKKFRLCKKSLWRYEPFYYWKLVLLKIKWTNSVT